MQYPKIHFGSMVILCYINEYRCLEQDDLGSAAVYRYIRNYNRMRIHYKVYSSEVHYKVQSPEDTFGSVVIFRYTMKQSL